MCGICGCVSSGEFSGGSAKSVDELHLLDGAARNLEKAGICDHNSEASRPGNRDVQAVFAVEEFDIARQVFGARSCHGYEHNFGFLPLEFIQCRPARQANIDLR